MNQFPSLVLKIALFLLTVYKAIGSAEKNAKQLGNELSLGACSMRKPPSGNETEAESFLVRKTDCSITMVSRFYLFFNIACILLWTVDFSMICRTWSMLIWAFAEFSSDFILSLNLIHLWAKMSFNTRHNPPPHPQKLCSQ